MSQTNMEIDLVKRIDEKGGVVERSRGLFKIKKPFYKLMAKFFNDEYNKRMENEQATLKEEINVANETLNNFNVDNNTLTEANDAALNINNIETDLKGYIERSRNRLKLPKTTTFDSAKVAEVLSGMQSEVTDLETKKASIDESVQAYQDAITKKVKINKLAKAFLERKSLKLERKIMNLKAIIEATNKDLENINNKSEELAEAKANFEQNYGFEASALPEINAANNTLNDAQAKMTELNTLNEEVTDNRVIYHAPVKEEAAFEQLEDPKAILQNSPLFGAVPTNVEPIKEEKANEELTTDSLLQRINSTLNELDNNEVKETESIDERFNKLKQIIDEARVNNEPTITPAVTIEEPVNEKPVEPVLPKEVEADPLGYLKETLVPKKEESSDDALAYLKNVLGIEDDPKAKFEKLMFDLQQSFYTNDDDGKKDIINKLSGLNIEEPSQAKTK